MPSTSLEVIDIDLAVTHRLVPSVWDEPPLAELLRDDSLAAVQFTALVGATEGQARIERTFAPGFLLPDNARLHSYVVNSAFRHGSADARFSSRRMGAWYCSDSLSTAQTEVAWHRSIEFGRKSIAAIERFFPVATQYSDWRCSPRTTVHEITDRSSAYLAPDDYRSAQMLAENLRQEGSLGIRYPSVRDPLGMNLALFHPTVVHPVALNSRLIAVWESADSPSTWREAA